MITNLPGNVKKYGNASERWRHEVEDKLFVAEQCGREFENLESESEKTKHFISIFKFYKTEG
jgi:hypothetical protein